jgi:hypothetical protein
MHGRAWSAALWAVMALPGLAWAQVPAGGEFRVNTYTAGYQDVRASSAAASADGRFVVVWESSAARDGSEYAVIGQRFEPGGTRIGSEFIVNTYTTGYQYFAAVAAAPRGGFVVSWQSYGQDGSREGVFAQRFDRAGARLGAELRANSFTTHTQSRASVGVDASGNFLVSWRSGSPAQPQDGDATGVFAQRFGAGGTAQGAEFRVNAYTTSYQDRPDVARAPDGSFVVVWQSNDQEGAASGYGIYARRHAADGTPLGAEFRVNTYTTDDQAWPAVGIDAAGNFVVAWTEYAPRDGSETSIRAQRFSSAGAPVGAEFQVNTYTTGTQFEPGLGVALDGGAFVVTWTSYGQDGSGDGVFGRRFNSAGVAVGAEFRANTASTGHQYRGNPAVDPSGNFTVVWESDAQDGSLTGVYAQRYGGLFPAALEVDTALSSGNENRVLEPGEEVDVAPSWRNLNGASQSFTGTLSGITGPPGATYTITDGTGSYGSVPNNTVAACSNCYDVSVSNPATRPAQHWDASVLETIAPAGQGQQKRWALHVGLSFSDVAQASPFYRFIETLFHHGVTGGCTATGYCPLSSTTRDQMSVFVLVAKEGAGYTPAACTTPVFGDVPASNPFCRFIEELVRRGVVAGCGGGNYCPSSPVTREQMSIFVLRTLDPALNPPACTTPMFLDVPASSPFCRWIEELARRGVVSGCGGGNYCPTAAVTREQMGVFISATFGLTLYGV